MTVDLKCGSYGHHPRVGSCSIHPHGDMQFFEIDIRSKSAERHAPDVCRMIPAIVCCSSE